MTEQEKREKVIKGLEYCAASCKGAWDENNGCPYMADFIKLGADHNGRCVDLLCEDAVALLKAQEATINDLYTRYEVLCKKIREKYESDDVCGLCQYDGAYVGESGDWMNECPGFETNECFCMKNSIRKMCGQPLIEEP